MAGIYIHIPFCKKLCYYCDFHFSVSLKNKNTLITALLNEIKSRKKQAGSWNVNSIYFGGGTPTVLSPDELHLIITSINENYRVNKDPEITLEANPEDLTLVYLDKLKKQTPVNRLSIGIQSFNDDHLKLMNRRHSAVDARRCVKRAQNAGFSNINIDLMYAIPGMTNIEWQHNLNEFYKLDVSHLSAYHLTFEPKTVFGHYLKKNKLHPVQEEVSLKQFEILMDFIDNTEYEQYEISNFCKNKHYSQHNLGYWTGMKYLGFGPSAHSYTGSFRSWNVSNNALYIDQISTFKPELVEKEYIDQNTAFNEYVLTSLRTRWGINKSMVHSKFSDKHIKELQNSIGKFITQEQVIETNDSYYLTNKGKLIADYIISELMFDAAI